MKIKARPFIVFLGVLLLSCYSSSMWAAPASNPEDRKSMQKIADDLKKALRTKNFNNLRGYMAEPKLFFGPCAGDEDPKNLMYSFDRFSGIFQEHTKDTDVKLNAAGFSVTFDGSEVLDFETEGGVPKEYRYLYFSFVKTKKDWRWNGICHSPVRDFGFNPSYEFK